MEPQNLEPGEIQGPSPHLPVSAFRFIIFWFILSAMANIPEELLRSTFAEFDKDGNGYLSAHELTPMFEMVAAKHGLKFSKKQVAKICDVSTKILVNTSKFHVIET